MSTLPEQPGPLEFPVRRRVSVWSWLPALVLAATLLYFSLRGVEWRRVWQIITHAHVGYLAAGAACACVGIFLRSLRWRIVLNAKEHLGVGTVFWATSAGYLGNNFLPLRAGEVVRCVMVSRCSSLSNAYVLTTALTERLIDAVTLVLFAAVAGLSLDAAPRWIVDLSRTALFGAGAGVVAFVVLPHVESRVSAILRRVWLPEKWRQWLIGIAGQCFLGLRAFHNVARFGAFGLMTLLIWSTDVCGVMLGTRALDMSVSAPVALLLVAALGLGSALPSTPGYVGIYQFVAVTVLAPFGFPRSAALAYILVAQATTYVVITVFGLIGLAKYRALKPGRPPAKP